MVNDGGVGERDQHARIVEVRRQRIFDAFEVEEKYADVTRLLGGKQKIAKCYRECTCH